MKENKILRAGFFKILIQSPDPCTFNLIGSSYDRMMTNDLFRSDLMANDIFKSDLWYI